jgi:ligand-binding sensor domain-containing protein
MVERVAALPQVTIRAITQTRDGYLWIDLQSDPVRWCAPITFDLANTRASSDGVLPLYEDRWGGLWIGTDDE